jgi:hypothetical protein
VDPEEVTRVILHVGDIANCYDELNHDDCLDGVAWALSKMPQWHRPTDRPRRSFDMYSVDIFSRKDITVVEHKCVMPMFTKMGMPGEGTATKSGLRNPPIKNICIGLYCGADQCGFD